MVRSVSEHVYEHTRWILCHDEPSHAMPCLVVSHSLVDTRRDGSHPLRDFVLPQSQPVLRHIPAVAKAYVRQWKGEDVRVMPRPKAWMVEPLQPHDCPAP